MNLKLMKELDFVLKARNKNDITLRHLFFTEKYTWCTDGKRLHYWTDGPTQEQGAYKVFLDKIELTLVKADAVPPDMLRVMPNYPASPSDINLKLEKHPTSISRALGILCAQYQRGLSCVNYEFLQDLVGHVWTVSRAHETPELKPLHFKNSVLGAIIMPIILK